jgi:MFS family permease
VLGLDVLTSAVAVSVYLIFYYTQVGFFVVYLLTNFGYSPARANSLANWYWAVSAIAMLAAGALSDRLHVRKPLMLTGAVISAAGSALVAVCSTRPDTSYRTFVIILVLAAVGNGLTFAPWMAAHTETVERRNAAATATGLAVWSAVNRIVVTIVLTIFALTVTAPSILVDHGTRVTTIAKAHPNVVHALEAGQPIPSHTTISPTELTYLKDHLPDVLTARQQGPRQWQTWWWICLAGQLAFCPLILRMAGHWRPRTARAELLAHAVRTEAALRQSDEQSPRRPSAR